MLNLLRQLVYKGNTVVIIEHNLDVIKCADWLIDLCPEGGDEGGEIIAEGTPEQIIKVPVSYTGRYFEKRTFLISCQTVVSCSLLVVSHKRKSFQRKLESTLITN